jgi:hypothetical protein
MIARYTKELALFHSQPAKQVTIQQVAADERRRVSGFRSKLAPKRTQWDDVVSETHHGTIYRRQASTRMLEAKEGEIICDWSTTLRCVGVNY